MNSDPYAEPLSNLDAKLRVAMRAVIKSLHQRLKTTTVYVTHDQIEAMTMADQIVVMNGGRVEQIGSPLALYDHPANVFVATFIGSPSMNLVSGEVVEHSGKLAVRAADATHFPLGSHVSIAKGRVVDYGFRPEHLSVSTSQDGIPALVEVTEPMGSETQVHVTMAGTPAIGVFRERIAASPGDVIYLRADVSKVNLFDHATGSAIV